MQSGTLRRHFVYLIQISSKSLYVTAWQTQIKVKLQICLYHATVQLLLHVLRKDKMRKRVDLCFQIREFATQVIERAFIHCIYQVFKSLYHRVLQAILMGTLYCDLQACSILREKDYALNIIELNLQNMCFPYFQIQALSYDQVVSLFIGCHFEVLRVPRPKSYRFNI